MIDHTQTVIIDGTHSARFFYLGEMDKAHVEVLQCMMKNQPVPMHLRPAAVGLNQAIGNLVNEANKPFDLPGSDTSPEANPE